MDKVTVTTADHGAARAVRDYENASGYIRHDSLVQAFARHRIEATRHAEEQIKLLREALGSINRHALCPVGHPDTLDFIAAEASQALEATNG